MSASPAFSVLRICRSYVAAKNLRRTLIGASLVVSCKQGNDEVPGGSWGDCPIFAP
jgi:hypothetical protein